VYLACRTRGGCAISNKCSFGALSRERIRNLAAQAGLDMIERVLQQAEKEGGI
jgi:nicotinamide mononucleotide (NMN) deamidase PncC